MEPKTIAVVQSSWKLIEPMAPKAAELFYANLFAADPGLRALFKGDMHQQGGKLMNMISVAVAKLDHLDSLLPALAGLGARHRNYGVKDTDYDTVATALLMTLDQGLGSAFTVEVRQAWTSVYATMASVMMHAGQSHGHVVPSIARAPDPVRESEAGSVPRRSYSEMEAGVGIEPA